MALNGLSIVFGSGKDFIPHIEMAAIKYTMRNYVMAQRVLTFGDMAGWNIRKVSEYLKYRRAQKLNEDVAIPDSKLVRARKSQIEPEEWGDRYRVSDRRVSTDLEDILSDVIEALGGSLGDQKEARLMNAALSTFIGGSLGSATTDYTIDLPISAQFEFRKRARAGQLFHVVHPFQARTVMQELVKYTGVDAGAALDFRNRAIAGWNIPSFDGLNIAVSDFLPRKIVHKLSIYGDSGTFRLALYDGQTAGVNLTAAIEVSATPATTVSNIKAALEALTFTGNTTWPVTGASNDDITITCPVYLDGDSELRVAVDMDNPTVEGEKSAYDLVGDRTGAPLDINGDELGVQIFEKSASAKSLLFYRNALVHDVRAGVRAYFELVNQGRTAEYSAYETYGVGGWQPELGMFIETKATSALAVS